MYRKLMSYQLKNNLGRNFSLIKAKTTLVQSGSYKWFKIIKSFL